MVTKISKSRFF